MIHVLIHAFTTAKFQQTFLDELVQVITCLLIIWVIASIVVRVSK